MQLIVCIAGLPSVAVDEIKANSPARFTGSKSNVPIMRPINPPYAFRPGMSDYYLGEIAKRLEKLSPGEEVGIALAYANYGANAQQFSKAFFPYAAASPFAPFYPDAREKDMRRADLLRFVERLRAVVSELRERIAIVRDVLSGRNFSPLTLPLRNFTSNVFEQSISTIFNAVGTAEDLRAVIRQVCTSILANHPLERRQDLRQRPYFRDDRSLRFNSPGQDRHGMARLVAANHSPACLINSRARLGGPLDPLFHYDCDYERGDLDGSYPNCHGVNTAPGKRTHVNIAPNDAVR